jgi:inositol-hexakisphosphate kinase
MSSSPSEPENAAPNGQVEPSNGSKISRDGDRHKNPRRTPPPRTKSTSLLTQGLATTYEVDELTPPTPTAPSTFPESIHPSARIPHDNTVTPPQDDGHRNDSLKQAQRDGADSISDTMAVVTAVAGAERSAGAGVGVGSAAGSTSTDFNLNSLFTGYRESLGKNRGRGTSLERTDREKRVHELPKGIYNTNPGDTGMSRAVTPLSSTSSASISTTNPTEGPRAQYRSWRDLRTVPSAEKAWSIGGNGKDDGHGGQVEKSITEALAGVEPNSRSRKSSHSLRFFKEGLPDDPRTRDTKNRGRSKESRYQKWALSSEEGFPHNSALPSPKDIAIAQSWTRSLDRKALKESPNDQDKVVSPQKHPSSNPTEGLVAEVGYFDVSNGIETITGDQSRAIPAELLADIRKHHNLTPGAAKGSSFSQSIPVTESERLKSKPSSDELAQLLFDAPEDGPPDHDESSKPKSADEEEDSGEEHIASALFVPHKTPHESPVGGSEEAQTTNPDQLKNQGSASPEWLEEHQVPPSIRIETTAASKAKEQPLQPPREEPVPVEGACAELPSQELHRDASEPQAQDEISLAPNTPEFEDDDVTPTGSLKDTSHIDDVYRRTRVVPAALPDEQKAKQARDAIELIPYRHQVGGHTTMWRFSKRAVCKQLNNGENMFYEKVEHYHPNLLSFLPRYVYFCYSHLSPHRPLS